MKTITKPVGIPHPRALAPHPGVIRFLMLLMLLLAATSPAAQAQFEYTVTGGAITITRYTCTEGAANIPSSIDGLPVTTIGEGAFAHCTGLTSVTIPDSVTSIRDRAFRNSGLTNITIGNGVASIGSAAFANCSSLAAIDVDPLNPKYSSQDGVLFDKVQLTLLQCPGGKAGDYSIPASVTSIDPEAFRACRRLTSVTIPTSIKSIGDLMFSDSTCLVGVSIPNSVAKIGSGAFEGCASLTNVTVPKSVTTIGAGAFSLCTSLKAIDVDPLNPAYGSLDGVLFNKNQSTLLQYPGGKAGDYKVPTSVTTIETEAFRGCTSLTAIEVDPSSQSYSSQGGVLFDKSQAVLIQYPGGKLGPYTIPSGVTTLGWRAFSDSTGLTRVTIPHSVSSIRTGALSRCTNLEAIEVDAFNPIYGSFEGALFTKSLGMLLQCPAGKAGTYTAPFGVISIGTYAFERCARLTSVTIPDTAKMIFDMAFFQCTGLEGVYFQGNAPPISYLNLNMFPQADRVTVYYLAGTTGWGASYAGRPTAIWSSPRIVSDDSNFGVSPAGFGFLVSWAPNASIVVEASTNLTRSAWLPVSTNTPPGGTFQFSDPRWTEHPSRLYRARTP